MRLHSTVLPVVFESRCVDHPRGYANVLYEGSMKLLRHGLRSLEIESIILRTSIRLFV